MRRAKLLALALLVGVGTAGCGEPDRSAPGPPTDPALQNAATSNPDVVTRPDTTVLPPVPPAPAESAGTVP